MSDVTPQPDAEREARYAEVIWTTSRADESTISATGANIVARAVMAVVDAEQAPLHARIRELEAEVERQAVLLRAINDCHLDPARAILQADKIAGAAILDRMKAEHVLARVEAHLAHLSGHPLVDHRAYVEALAAALAGTDTPAAPEASHTCPLCGLAGGHAVQETPKWVDLLGADPTFELMPDPEVTELRAEHAPLLARIRELEHEAELRSMDAEAADVQLSVACSHANTWQARAEKAEAQVARVEALRNVTHKRALTLFRLDELDAALAGTDTPAAPEETS